ncbi:hypothetical protein J3459_015816 [Metarhizium acridum]|nr:hypothetical protein J3459_015816 [Metarhizium acridum]
MDRAERLLCRDGLFQKSDGGNFDTMYEGTGTCTKLESWWNSFARIKLFLLPMGKYCVIDHPVSPGERVKYGRDLLAFPSPTGLVLSLVHRAFFHKDQIVKRCLHRMKLSVLADKVRSLPSTWDDEPWRAEARGSGLTGVAYSPRKMEKRWYWLAMLTKVETSHYLQTRGYLETRGYLVESPPPLPAVDNKLRPATGTADRHENGKKRKADTGGDDYDGRS